MSVAAAVVCFEKLELAGVPDPKRSGLTLIQRLRLTFLEFSYQKKCTNISGRV